MHLKKRRAFLVKATPSITASLLFVPALLKTRSSPFSGLFCPKKILSSVAGMDTALDMEMIGDPGRAAKIEGEKLRR